MTSVVYDKVFKGPERFTCPRQSIVFAKRGTLLEFKGNVYVVREREYAANMINTFLRRFL